MIINKNISYLKQLFDNKVTYFVCFINLVNFFKVSLIPVEDLNKLLRQRGSYTRPVLYSLQPEVS